MSLRRGRLLALFLAVAFSCGGWAAETFRYPEGKHLGGELKYINGLPVLMLEGKSKEIGEQAAALTADSVRPLLGLPKELLKQHGIESAWPVVVAVAKTMMKNVPEAYRQELETAIRVGRVDEDVLVVANCMLELRRLGGCSTLYVDAKRS